MFIRDNSIYAYLNFTFEKSNTSVSCIYEFQVDIVNVWMWSFVAGRINKDINNKIPCGHKIYGVHKETSAGVDKVLCEWANGGDSPALDFLVRGIPAISLHEWPYGCKAVRQSGWEYLLSAVNVYIIRMVGGPRGSNLARTPGPPAHKNPIRPMWMHRIGPGYCPVCAAPPNARHKYRATR